MAEIDVIRVNQAMLNSLVLAQMLIEVWDTIEEAGYKPQRELKFHLKGYKREAEKIIGTVHKMLPRENEMDWLHEVTAKMELLKAYDEGKVEVLND